MSTATAEQTILDAVKPQLYIGGEWRDGGEGGDPRASRTPPTGETLAEVADATVDDAKAALGAAARDLRAVARHAPRASAATSCAAPTTSSPSAPTTSRCS